MRPRVRYLLLILFFCSLGAAAAPLTDAQQLAQRYPAGSITTAEMADRAISEAASLHNQLQRQYDAKRQQCEQQFFVNACMGKAHQVQRDGEKEVRRITLEAHDLQRHLNAQAHSESQAAQRRREAAEELQRPEREREAMQESQAREKNSQAKAEEALRKQQSAEQSALESEQRQREQAADWARKDALRPQQEAESLREFQQKQEQASAYAKTRERDREVNAKRRAERQSARQAQSAGEAASPAPAPSTP